MRLFFAVELDEPVRRAAAEVSRSLAAALGRSRDTRITWVADENLHVTLKFLGEVDEAHREPLLAAMAAPVRVAAFDIALRGVGTFPRAGPPRVIWLGVSEGAQTLGALHAEIDGRVHGLGFAKDDRPFSAHVTLGRVRQAGRAPFRSALDGVAADAGRCQVTHVTLFESQLSPRGSRYEPVARTHLAGAREGA